MKIICPTDFSSTATNALKYGLMLAQKFDSELDLIHIYEVTAEESTIKDQTIQVVPQGLKKEQELKLQKYTEEVLADPNVNFSPEKLNQITIEGDAIDEISNYSKNTPFHLVVMGTKGESNQDETPIGSITSEVIRNVYSPVLAIPSGAMFKGIKRIVYAVDYDAYDKFTINSLASFAGKFDAELVILHINPVENYFDSERWVNFKRTLNSSYDYENLKFEFLQNENIIDAINEYIVGHHADIVAMLTRSYHLIDKAYKRSLTRKMALHLNVPLLAFHD